MMGTIESLSEGTRTPEEMQSAIERIAGHYKDKPEEIQPALERIADNYKKKFALEAILKERRAKLEKASEDLAEVGRCQSEASSSTPPTQSEAASSMSSIVYY